MWQNKSIKVFQADLYEDSLFGGFASSSGPYRSLSLIPTFLAIYIQCLELQT